jgi:predicted nucleic-acid-binding Zn-ribbon protein
MKNDSLENSNLNNSNRLTDNVLKVDINSSWECCNCGWIGKHSESADKTPVLNNMWLLVCPKCGNKDEFHPNE